MKIPAYQDFYSNYYRSKFLSYFYDFIFKYTEKKLFKLLDMNKGIFKYN